VSEIPLLGGGGRADKTCKIHAGLGRKALQEIGDPLER
jgi:hypothetical protein